MAKVPEKETQYLTLGGCQFVFVFVFVKNEALARACLKRLHNVYTGWMSALWRAERGPEITLRGLGKGRERFLGASEFLIVFVTDFPKI